MPWATREYVVMEGSEYLKVEPLTLDAPFPCTRSGFYKVSFLVKAKEGADFDKFYSHWLNIHVPNVRSVIEKVDGFRLNLTPDWQNCISMTRWGGQNTEKQSSRMAWRNGSIEKEHSCWEGEPK